MAEANSAPSAPEEKPMGGRTENPVALAIGAVFRGYRKGDQQVRERVHSVGKKVGRVSIAIAALTLAGQALGLLGTSLKHNEALVAAIDRQSEKIAAQTEKIGVQTERLGDLVDAIRDDRTRRDADHAAVMQRLGGRR